MGIEKNLNHQKVRNNMPISPTHEETGYYPLSSAEQRMFVLYQLEPDSLNYNMPAILAVQGRVDWARFQEVFQTLIQRHEAFRTSFILVDGQPVQRLHQQVDFTLPRFSVQNEKELQDLTRRFIRPFNLDQAPLMRACFVECGKLAYFVLDLHHIIADGFSMGIFVREFEQLYAGQTLPDLQVQYRDYRIWQKTFLQSDKLKQQEAFWLSTYADEPPVLNMPVDKPRGAARSYAGEVITFTLDRDIVTALRKFAASQKMTLYMTLFAVYNLLLAKYTGQDDLVVGTPVAGRSHPAFHGVIGMFVNTLAIRVRLTPGKIFTTYLQQVRECLLAAFANQDYPFDLLVTQLDAATDIARNPLFDTFFSLQGAEDVQTDFAGLRFTQLPFETGVAKFDLSLDGTVLDGQINFGLEYCTALFSRAKMEQLVRHFQILLNNILAEPQKRLVDLEILSPEEKRQIIREFNPVCTDYPEDVLLHQAFEGQARQNPARIALRYHEQALTYQELNSRANQLARHLREKGVGPETIVALLLDPCPEEIIAMLAVMKAGGAYLPIDTANPPERIRLLLDDSKPLLILTAGNTPSVDDAMCSQAGQATAEAGSDTVPLTDCLPSSGKLSYETLDLTRSQLYTGDSSDLPVTARPENLAYIIYTSGSTGRPKGVMIEHRNLLRYTCSFRQFFNWKADDICIHVTSYSFDASIDELYQILLVGGSLVIVDKEEILDIPHLAQVITETGVTIFGSTPLLLNELNKLPPFPSIHSFLSGGDLLKPEYINNLLKYAKVYNLYGPTETTVSATAYQCSEPIPERIPIGKPYVNFPLYILSKAGEPVPVGVEGEICIGGVGVARGYLHQPELTADKFVPDPFHPGRRMYRTGDRGRWLTDGTVDFIGRVDYQIKIRGYRIEPGEIEQKLITYPGVEDAIVIERQNATGDKYLCAYIVPGVVGESSLITEMEPALTVAALKSHLGKVLPEYMIPARFVLIEAIPRNSTTGKVDRKRLPEPPEAGSEGEYSAPVTHTEIRLAEIWSALLGVSRVGRQANFFALGGHSLKATALVVQIYQVFHVEIALRQIFATATLADLAALIDQTSKSGYRAIAPAGDREYYPASSAQKRLYILHQYEGIQTTYNLPGMFRIEGTLDRGRFNRAIQMLVERHEAFRTSFAVVDGAIVQQIHSEADLPVSYLEAEESMWEELAGGMIRPFDLAAAPLARVGLIRSQTAYCLIFDMHHIISDAVSFNILITDFVACYQGIKPEPLEIQYKDFAVWQNAYFLTEEMQKQENYWLERFAGELPLLNLPTDYTRPTVQSFEGAMLQFQLEPELVRKIHDLRQVQGATLYMTLLAAYTILLAKYSGQDDIIVGSPIAGRDYPGLEKILGMFVNTLAMRNHPASERTFMDFLAEVRENALHAYENQDYPFELLVERLDVQRNVARNPLFDTVLVVQNADEGELVIPELTFRPLQLEHKVSRFDMTWTVEEAGGLSLSVEYSTKLFREPTISRMTRHFTSILQAVTANPYIRLKEIEMLTVEEKAHLLAQISSTQAEYPRTKTVQQLFEEQVQRTPERVALLSGELSLTYHELNARANRLARALRVRGIGPDKIVGILLQRGVDLLVAILAIVKAGGAYLPLDPDYPRDRIEYMLQDSGAPILLTDQADAPAGFAGEVLHPGDESIYRVKVGSEEHAEIDGNHTDNGDMIEEFMIDEFFNDSLEESSGSDTPVAITPSDTDECSLITDDSNLTNINRPGDLLYIIYTSGSTGKPKGVMIEHRNLVRLMCNDGFQFAFNEDDVWTLFHSPCFDFSVWEMYGALLYGGSLVIVPKVTAQNPVEFLQLLRERQVTVLNQTPTAFYKLQEEEMQNLRADLTLRYVIFGGEALQPLKLAEWHSRYPDTRLINMYGITETTVHVTYKEITAREIRAGVSNIGTPIPTLTTYILNRDLQLAPVGVPGELCVGGAGLARGYLNRPELTAERFINHPFEQGAKLYRSGDLGKLLANGEIEYLGRIDHQVKIRGFRIELGEIETRLLQHTAVNEAVVLDYKDAEGQMYLAAYLVTERELPVAEVRTYLLQSLPDYMVPAYFIRLKELPLTSNGKLNRAALPRPEGQVLGRDYVTPATGTEARLALIWQEVLGIQQVGREDDFFELGGHSLKATALIQKIKKELRVELPLKEIFKTTVLKDLARQIDLAAKGDFCAIEPLPEQEYYPVSAVQKRIYLYHQIHGANTVYNIPDALLLEGELDMARFRTALTRVIQRHEAFRTSFKKIQQEIVQVIAPAVDLQVAELDLTGFAADGPVQGKIDYASPLAAYLRSFIQPFDLAQAPLLRVGIGRLGRDTVLIFDMHHIISDGTSMSILVADFLKAYAGEELPPLRVQYKDFAVWQNRLFASEAIKTQEAYWRSVFAEGVPVLQLPLDYERPEVLTGGGALVRFQLAEEKTAQLYELAKASGGTLFMVLLAAFSILLARYSGQEEIVTGTPVAGRSHADLDEIIGMFINTLALKTQPAGSKTFRQYLAEVREVTLQAFEHQDYQFEQLIDQLGLHIPPNRTPLFDVLLVLQNMGHQTSNGSLTVQPLQLDSGTAKYDLSLYVVENHGLQFNLDYRVSLFKQETVEVFAERLVQLLTEIIAHPDLRIAELTSSAEPESCLDLSGFMDDLEDEV